MSDGVDLGSNGPSIPTVIVIKAIKNSRAVNNPVLLPNGKDKIGIRVTVKDDNGSTLSNLRDREVKFKVEAKEPDININGYIDISTADRNNEAQARQRVKDIYQNKGVSEKTAKKMAGIAPHTGSKLKVIPRGTRSETEKTIQNGQAKIEYTAPNLGGNQPNSAVDRVIATLPAQAGSNLKDTEQSIDIKLSYSERGLLHKVVDDNGFHVGTTGGKYATHATINKIKKAGKYWKDVHERDKGIFSIIKKAEKSILFPYLLYSVIIENDIDEAINALKDSKIEDCLKKINTALKEIDGSDKELKKANDCLKEATKKHEKAKEENSIPDDLQIIRNDKDIHTSKAITEAVEEYLEKDKKENEDWESYTPFLGVKKDLEQAKKKLEQKNIEQAMNDLEQAKKLEQAVDDTITNANYRIDAAYENLQYVNKRPDKFVITALSLRHGGMYAPHKTHRNGKDVDVLLMPREKKNRKKWVPKYDKINDWSNPDQTRRHVIEDWMWTDKRGRIHPRTYDRPLTRLLVEIFLSVGATKIGLQDAVLIEFLPTAKKNKMRNWGGHHHHLHVEFH